MSTRAPGVRRGLSLHDFSAVLEYDDGSGFESSGGGGDGGSEDSSPILVDSFEVWARAANYGGAGPLLDQSGNGHDARFGSTANAYLSDEGLVLPGLAGNNASVPDEAALDITGDIDIRASILVPDWTPAGDVVITAKFTGTAATTSYLFFLTSGRFRLHMSTGASILPAVATADAGITDGTASWVRVTRRQSDGRVQFLRSDNYDPDTLAGTWTQIGTDVTLLAGSAINASTTALTIGTYPGAGFHFSGIIYRQQIFNGIAGTKVFDADFSGKMGQSSFVASTGQIVTINSVGDANDPIHLKPDGYVFGGTLGTCHAYFPGVTGNTANVPDSAPLDITGDIDIRVEVALTDWTPGTEQGLVSKWTGTTSTSSFLFAIGVTGLMRFYFANGSTSHTAVGDPTGIADGDKSWVRVTRRQSDGRTQFFKSTDGSSWTQVGPNQTIAVGVSINATAAVVAVGGFATGAASTGKFYKAKINAALDDTDTRLEIDFTDRSRYDSAFTQLAAITVHTVTLTRPTSGRKIVIVNQPYVLTGTDDHLEIADHAMLDFAAGEPFTICFVYRSYGTSSVVLICKRPGAGAANVGWSMFETSAAVSTSLADGTTQIERSHTPKTPGIILATASRRSSGILNTFINGSSSANAADTTTNLSNAHPVRVAGYAAGGGAYSDIQLIGYGISRLSLTEIEIAQALVELLRV